MTTAARPEYNGTATPAVGIPLDRHVGPTPRRLRVSFACNDPENPGRVWAAHPESLYRVGRHPWDAELTHDDWGRGAAFTVDAPRMRLRLHRRWFAYKRCIPYFGNMMWDAFEFERDTGACTTEHVPRVGELVEIEIQLTKEEWCVKSGRVKDIIWTVRREQMVSALLGA